jgi:hypothetical protein
MKLTTERKLINELWDALSDILEDPLCTVTDAYRRAGLRAITHAANYQAAKRDI